MTVYDPFATDYSTEDVTSESVHEGGGGGVQIEGRYHVQIESVEYVAAEVAGDDRDDEGYSRTLPHIKVQMKVLNGENPSEVGKGIWHRVFLGSWKDVDGNDHRDAGQIHQMNDKQFNGVLAFLHAFGVVGDEIFGQAKVKLDLDMFERLENMQAIVKVTMSEERTNERTGKVYKPSAQMWNNDAWPLSHPDVEDVPKDHDAAAMAATGELDDSDLGDI